MTITVERQKCASIGICEVDKYKYKRRPAMANLQMFVDRFVGRIAATHPRVT